MYRLSDADSRIAQARHVEDPLDVLQWASFDEFFRSRVGDPVQSGRLFLLYYDDDRHVQRSYTYAEFGAAVGRMADLLRRELGLGRGDRLATVLCNHDLTVVLYFAAWTLGVAIVPINADEPPDKQAYIVTHADCTAVACWKRDAPLWELLQSEAPALRAVLACAESRDGSPLSMIRFRRAAETPIERGNSGNLHDDALIVYTSGTTGAPKGVVLTVQNLLLDADAIATSHRFDREDRLMCVLPIHHVNGTVVTLITPFYCRGAAVLNRRFKSATFWRRLQDEGITCVSVVPTLLEFLLDAEEDVGGYRLDRFGGFICGAGPLLKETAIRFEERFGFPIRHGYGLSETTCYACFLPNNLTTEEHRHWLWSQAFPSIGAPLRHTRMAILDGEGRPVPEGARGEICIGGGIVCAGYYKREDANDAAFQWGWFRSGDEGYALPDEQGRAQFFISGRQKELIIRGGVNVSPLEIDEVLKSHPGVKCALAVPFENRYYGEEIAAYVVPRDRESPPSTASLFHLCRQLPFWKRPKVILFGEDLFYTATGKPKRLELKARLAGQLAMHRDTQFKEPV